MGNSPILLPRTTQYDINGVNKIGVKDTRNEVTEGRRIVRCNSGTRGITFLLTEENSVATLCQQHKYQIVYNPCCEIDICS